MNSINHFVRNNFIKNLRFYEQYSYVGEFKKQESVLTQILIQIVRAIYETSEIYIYIHEFLT